MNTIGKAISHYNDKDFRKALELFEQAGQRYGLRIVKTNIHLCKKALYDSSNFQPNQPFLDGGFDPATMLMLTNAGEIELIETDKRNHLSEYKKKTGKKSEDAQIKPVNPIPSDWPADLNLAPLPESTNDYLWHYKRKLKSGKTRGEVTKIGLSIIVPTYNRTKILSITLSCLVNQKTSYPFEVIVADDGSNEEIVKVVRKYESKLDIKYVRQKDYGYQLCAVRNLGLRTARYDFVSILDCDMAPNQEWVNNFIELLKEDDDVALIGPRKYIDTQSFAAADFENNPALLASLPETVTNNDIAGKIADKLSVDWRVDHFKETDNLRLCDTPFRFFSGGNIAFAKKWLDIAGWFDEEFTNWGGEDNEFGYRLYRHGCFFRSVDGGLAYHQEPPGKENETDRAEGKKITINIVREKVPYFYRKIMPIEASSIQKKPLVSIYVPAYNCEDQIVRCVDSALNQTIVDLEVCICDDGSTDNTLEILRENYTSHPRVRFLTQSNSGIAAASNAAVKMCEGYYIGQLDSDDYLEPDAVELCLNEFLKDRQLTCVYTTNRNVNPDGSLIANGYNWPKFSREKLTTAMIVHHFRMFTARAWNLTEGFNESLENAVDYDMYLKLSEVGHMKHVNKISYNRVLHGNNTSVKKIGLQKINHFISVNNSLKRQGIKSFNYAQADTKESSDRSYYFKSIE